MRLTRASLPILAALLMLGACEDDTATTTAASTPPHPKIPIQQFLPDNVPPPGTAPAPADNGGAAAPDQAAAAAARVNDPSAPLDTPLCGRAARETIAADAAISPAVIPGAGACAETACFDPLTDTYIGADGARHVCQE